MFRRRLAWIVSDEGFSVRAVGRSALEYREGKKKVRIDAEMLIRPSGFVIYPGSLRCWAPPYDDMVIDEAKRAVIVDNIRRAFRSEGFEVEVG